MWSLSSVAPEPASLDPVLEIFLNQPTWPASVELVGRLGATVAATVNRLLGDLVSAGPATLDLDLSGMECLDPAAAVAIAVADEAHLVPG